MRDTYCIWIVTPPGYPHSRCFEELALALQSAFAELGYLAPVVTDPDLITGAPVVLGANLLPHVQAALPADAILYNLEQIEATGSIWLQPAYFDLLRTRRVWDYSPRNIRALAELGIAAELCGVGYAPELTRIAHVAAQDIDVLMVGSPNRRRDRILDQLTAGGAVVASHFNVYGEARDALYARARIILNVHFFDARVFEMVRVSYVLANGFCVVSETGVDVDLERPLADGVAFAPYDAVVRTCEDLLREPQRRRDIAAAGFRRFSAMRQAEYLAHALGAAAASPSPDQ